MRKNLNIRLFKTPLVELSALACLPMILDLLIPGDAAFISVYSVPYALVLPAATGFFGIWAGLLAFMVAVAQAVAVFFLAGPGIAGLSSGLSSVPTALAENLAAVALLALVLALLVDFGRNRILRFRNMVLQRFRRSVHRSVDLGKQKEVLEKVNRVLEGRVSAQKDSITILHDQVKKLGSLSMDMALNTILETIALFTEMSAGAIWTMSDESRVLVPAAVWGWEADKAREASLDPEHSIEGYVYRNSKPFSMRMLLDDAEFDRFDTSRNIITLPVLIGGRSWGVLNVEALPFERYSQYTETILAILLSLAEPYLKQIREYDNLNEEREVDAVTGFPLFSILYRTLEQDLERIRYEPGFVTMVIIEIANFGDLVSRKSREEIKTIFMSFKGQLDKRKAMKYKAFHFKEDSQLVLLVYDLDQDGTSFFCLDLLALFSEQRFSIGDESVPVELVIGFSNSSQSGSSADAMIDAAEYLLTVQRI